jgi:hypothetical protein
VSTSQLQLFVAEPAVWHGRRGPVLVRHYGPNRAERRAGRRGVAQARVILSSIKEKNL